MVRYSGDVPETDSIHLHQALTQRVRGGRCPVTHAGCRQQARDSVEVGSQKPRDPGRVHVQPRVEFRKLEDEREASHLAPVQKVPLQRPVKRCANKLSRQKGENGEGSDIHHPEK